MDSQPHRKIAPTRSSKELVSTKPAMFPLPRDSAEMGEQVSTSTDEQPPLLFVWNETHQPYATISYLHTLFEQQAARSPDAIALVFEDQSLTYAMVNRHATRLGRLLQSVGVRPDVLVALYLERSLEMIIAILAVLKAGGAYVPLDPLSPPERLAFMLQDCAAPIILTQPQLQTNLPAGYSGRVMVLEKPSCEVESDVDILPWQGHPLQAVNLLYTSGSTGQPKGVINTHQGLYNRLCWMQDRYLLQPGDRVLQKTPYTFDVSGWEIFWPLHYGATMVLARPGGHQDSAYLAQLIVNQRITVIHFVPSMLDMFLGESGLSECETLRYVFCSGEALSIALQQRFFTCLNAELHNLYGPTEAAIDVTSWACLPESLSTTIPIGKPIYNTYLVLLDQHGMPVPPGTPAELYIGGMGLARGYHQRPDLTAERFLPDPSNIEPGARLYRTGDLVRELPDGNLEYLGRLDHQVKLRGQRIELEEIEFAIRKHPKVRACLVQVQTIATNDQRLVAYIIPHNEQLPPHAKDLRALLRLSLPAYMIPTTFLFLHAWPLLSNGKIDRRALPVAPIARGTPSRQ